MGRSIRMIVLTKNLEGGIGTFIADLLKINNEFDDLFIDIKLLVLEDIPSGYSEKKNSNLDKYNLNLRNIGLFIRRLSWFYLKISQYRPDLILSVEPQAIVLAEFSRALFFLKRVKTISTFHNNFTDSIKARSSNSVFHIFRWILYILLKKSDEVVCVSEGLALSVKRDLGLVVCPKVIYYGVPKLKNLKIKERNSSIILTVCRFVKQKDLFTLIRAFSLVAGKDPDAVLWLGGDGPLKNELVSYVRSLRITTRVKFLGWLKNPIKFINASDIFVLSSEREGLPYVLLEAMSCGKPVISTSTPFGPAEILDNGKYGLLTAVGDYLGMSEAILNLLKNKKDYLHFSRQAVLRSQYFTVNKMLLQYRLCILGAILLNNKEDSFSYNFKIGP